MSALPYMPLYVADYLADTSHLSTTEHGAYLLLIMNYWQRGKPLPASDIGLSRIARLSMDEWLAAKPLIEPLFVTSESEWRHNRIEAELEHVRNRTEAKARAGKASAKAKAQQKPNTAPTQTDTSSTPVEHVINNTNTDTDTNRGDKSPLLRGDGFAEFWEAYPERSGTADQAKAKAAFYDCLLKASASDLTAAASAYRQWCIENGKMRTPYVKTAHLWLSEGAWVEWVPKVAAAMEKLVLVKAGSSQWTAWQTVKKTPISEKTGGWYFTSEWPPGHPNFSEAA